MSANRGDALSRGSKLQNGRYIIEATLGEGGFGITYHATDTRLNRKVAIKELYPGGSQRKGHIVTIPAGYSRDRWQKSVAGFLREAQTIANLEHPAIVAVHDQFEENNTAYMVMRYIDGANLMQLAQQRGGKLPEAEALRYIAEVGKALGLLHQSGILHRDIKPSNIIVNGSGHAVLVDFGAAREFVADQTLTHSVMLTPGFAPPEQFQLRARRGPTTDIYALAATCYYLLTGNLPDLTDDGRLADPHLSPRLRAALEHALAYTPAARPPTVTAFLAELQGRATVPPPPARQVSPTATTLPNAPQPVVTPDAAVEHQNQRNLVGDKTLVESSQQRGYTLPPLYPLPAEKRKYLVSKPRQRSIVLPTILVSIGVLLFLSVLIILLLGDTAQKNKQISDLLTQARAAMASAQSTPDKSAQRNYLTTAASELDEAAKLSPDDADLRTARAKWQQISDDTNLVTRLPQPQLLFQLPSASNVTSNSTGSYLSAVLVQAGDAYLLDRGAGVLYRYKLDGSEAAKPILASGDATVKGKLLYITWRVDSVLAIDDAYNAYLYNPTSGQTSIVALGGSGSFNRPLDIASFDGNLYILGAKDSQIEKYSAGHYDSGPLDWLDGSATSMVGGATKLAVDGNFYVLTNNSRILRFIGGQLDQQFDPNAGSDAIVPPANTPHGIITSADNQYIYTIEATGGAPDDTGGRILRFSKDGKLLRQYMAEIGSSVIADLRSAFVSPDDSTLYLLTASRLYRVALPAVPAPPASSNPAVTPTSLASTPLPLQANTPIPLATPVESTPVPNVPYSTFTFMIHNIDMVASCNDNTLKPTYRPNENFALLVRADFSRTQVYEIHPLWQMPPNYSTVVDAKGNAMSIDNPISSHRLRDGGVYYVCFYLTPSQPQNVWSVGSYRVNIYINNGALPVVSKDFAVVQ